MTTMPLAMTKFTCEAGAISPWSSKTRPGLGMRMTSSLRPKASVAASSMRAISFNALALGSSAPAEDWQTTRPGPTKRASVSIWPSVWSFRRPRSIQRMRLAPKASRSAVSAWASVQPLRFALSRVCRVARRVPSPSCSIAPPSRTKSNLRTGAPASLAISSPTVVSSGRSNLPPQPLVMNLKATGPPSLRAKIGPVSRSQMSP